MRHNSDARNRPRGRRVRRFCLDPKRLLRGARAPRDDAAPSSAPAVSVEPAYDAAEPSPSSPFTYDGAGDRAEPAAGGFDSFDPFPGIPAPTKPQEPALTAEEDAPTTRALSQYEEEEDLDGVARSWTPSSARRRTAARRRRRP